jgi:hypothetical protein
MIKPNSDNIPKNTHIHPKAIIHPNTVKDRNIKHNEAKTPNILIFKITEKQIPTKAMIIKKIKILMLIVESGHPSPKEVSVIFSA